MTQPVLFRSAKQEAARSRPAQPLICALLVYIGLILFNTATSLYAGELLAGAAKIDITDYDAGPVNDPLYVKALVLQSGDQKLVIATVDAVAIGELGRVKSDYLPQVRSRLEQEFGISPDHVLINASHCHGVVLPDISAKTVEAVQLALQRLVPVRVGVGSGHEERISENRRFKLKSGREADVRHAYSIPPDDEIVAAGPIDPQIGLLRLDDAAGKTVAAVYNFACHPIQGVPSGGNTADITGFSSNVIEENSSNGTIALFLQGCGGDINPRGYKVFDQPRNAESLGNLLGLSALAGLRKIQCKTDDRLVVRHATIELPRRDLTDRIAAMEKETARLLAQLRGTSLNLKTFLPLAVRYNLDDAFPSSAAHQYMTEQNLGRDDLARLDTQNRKLLQEYIANVKTMEELTRLQTNLALLKKHQASFVSSGKRTITVEVSAIRIGGFMLVTFPGELTVPIGLGIKQRASGQNLFVAGYTNGYIYYAPTSEQLLNSGYAQEDCDCMLAPEWQQVFEAKVADLLQGL